MTKEAGKYEGMFYAKASNVIVQDLTESGHLLYHSKFVHSYPHDWRSKKPVISERLSNGSLALMKAILGKMR